MFVFLHLIIHTTSSCFYGTTSSCQFQCHCADDNNACVSERSLESGSCSSGCKSIDGESGITIGDKWNGPGCQVGNIVNKSTIECIGCESENNVVATSLVDGSIEQSSCFLTDTPKIRVKFDIPVEIYNISLVIKRGRVFHTRGHFFTLNSIYVRTSFDHSPLIPGPFISITAIDLAIYGEQFYLCELIINGYQYTECEVYKDEFYYGPGCLLKCTNCAVQCDINGQCAKCTSTFVGPECKKCISGHWGEKCDKVCHCKNESCSDETGECPITGCADGYKGIACDHFLLNLNHTTPVVKYNNSDIFISLHEVDYINISFIIEYRIDGMEWIQCDHKCSKKEIKEGCLFVYPEYNVAYYLRLSPFDLKYGVLGEPSNYVQIYFARKLQNEKQSLQTNSNKNSTGMSQIIWIILICVIALLFSIITAVICICKHKYTDTEKTCPECEERKEKPSEMDKTYEDLQFDTSQKSYEVSSSEQEGRKLEDKPKYYTPLHIYANTTE